MNDSGQLTMREKELIAVGASMAGNCASCLMYHFAAAQKAGASLAEIAEAVAIGRAVQAEPINQLRQLAERLLEGGDAPAAQPVQIETGSVKKSC
ncbi:MAG: carboxymuconolactone decarboxylase family protein [Bacillota bacterium]